MSVVCAAKPILMCFPQLAFMTVELLFGIALGYIPCTYTFLKPSISLLNLWIDVDNFGKRAFSFVLATVLIEIYSSPWRLVYGPPGWHDLVPCH